MSDVTVQGNLWSSVASSRRETHARWSLPIYQSIFEHLTLARGTSYLDVGCGTGEGCKLAVQLGLVATGIDPSEQMIHWAQEAVPSATFMIATAAALPLPDATVSLATSVNSIHFCPRPHRALIEIRRVLVPGGHIAVHCIGPREECAISEVFRDLLALVPLDSKHEPQFVDPFCLAAVGVVDDMLDAADMTAIESYYVPLTTRDATMDDAIARFKNIGLFVAVSAVVGEPRALAVLRQALDERLQPDGSVVFSNTGRVVLARRP